MGEIEGGPAPADPLPPDGHQDLEASENTSRQWRNRRRSRRLALAGRLGAPLAVIAVLDAVLVRAHGTLGGRAAISLRPALVIIAVALPLGCLSAVLAIAAVRRRDRSRPAGTGERYAGRAVLQVEVQPGPPGYLDAGLPSWWYRGSKWALGELRLVEDGRPGDYGWHWQPSEGWRARGFQPLSIRAADVSATELELHRPRYGYVRIWLVPHGFVDFGVMDMPRLAQALTPSPLTNR